MPAIDNNIGDQSDTAMRLLAVTPSDSADLAYVARQIYVGVAGDVSVIDTSGNTVTHKNAAAGGYLGPFKVARVLATNTTATNLIAYV